ncbi:hypothetical protein GR925_38830 [Streptomyces sp. HUCO-GS316]|uniref:hypothetical protein n=1 Tax=Streptomyces sp. HUCO-GS316 TaxID=2692198 RepID=UPI00136A23D0|nr:hypothetical protein [Streptomyces sp. HUCO-GS316]MXM69190.1 hypothetical protein [Streptomyces sp. HUCO-GS316]
MTAPARYTASARRLEDGEAGELLAFRSVTDPADLAEVIAEFQQRYADRPDVLLDLDTTPSV